MVHRVSPPDTCAEIRYGTRPTRYHEDTTGILELLGVDVAGDVAIAARRREGGGYT